ncbi:hypothetical protein BJX96DRAFT_95350 [Aspergillus floccosus]
MMGRTTRYRYRIPSGNGKFPLPYGEQSGPGTFSWFPEQFILLMYSCILRPYLPSLHDLGERKCYGQTQGSLDLTAISHGKPPKTNLTHQDGATTVGPASLSLPPPAVVAVRWIFGSCHCCAAGARLSTTVPPGHKRIPPLTQLSSRGGLVEENCMRPSAPMRGARNTFDWLRATQCCSTLARLGE